MNKVLVELCVPAIGEYFDIFAPLDVPVGDLIGVMAGGVVELTNGKYNSSKKEQLCLSGASGLLDPTLTLQDYGVKTGMRLYLI